MNLKDMINKLEEEVKNKFQSIGKSEKEKAKILKEAEVIRKEILSATKTLGDINIKVQKVQSEKDNLVKQKQETKKSITEECKKLDDKIKEVNESIDEVKEDKKIIEKDKRANKDNAEVLKKDEAILSNRRKELNDVDKKLSQREEIILTGEKEIKKKIEIIKDREEEIKNTISEISIAENDLEERNKKAERRETKIEIDTVASNSDKKMIKFKKKETEEDTIRCGKRMENVLQRENQLNVSLANHKKDVDDLERQKSELKIREKELAELEK